MSTKRDNSNLEDVTEKMCNFMNSLSKDSYDIANIKKDLQNNLAFVRSKIKNSQKKEVELTARIHLRIYQELFIWMYENNRISVSDIQDWDGWKIYGEGTPVKGLFCLEQPDFGFNRLYEKNDKCPSCLFKHTLKVLCILEYPYNETFGRVGIKNIHISILDMIKIIEKEMRMRGWSSMEYDESGLKRKFAGRKKKRRIIRKEEQCKNH